MTEAPTDLGEAGLKLWAEMNALADAAEGYEFDEKDVHLLELACRQSDDVALLEAALKTEGIVTTGSQGQPVLSKIVTELRGQRESVARLLRQIDWPAEEKLTPAQAARKAARARWSARPGPNNAVPRVLPEAR
jgi:hypothetical protein